MIILFIITLLLVTAGFYFFCKYSKCIWRYRANADALRRSKVQSGQSSFSNASHWRDLFNDDDDEDEVNLSKIEADEVTVTTGGGRRGHLFGRTPKEVREVDHRYHDRIFSDDPVIAKSSVAPAAHCVGRDSVTRTRIEKLRAPSFDSSHDDSLHLFNDSNHGSVHII